MVVLFKPNIEFISEHAVDPDKRRYAVTPEGPRHFIDIDNYGKYPYPDLPHNWNDAVSKYEETKLNENKNSMDQRGAALPGCDFQQLR